MGSLIAHTHVIARDSLGQFLDRTHRAAMETVRDTAEKGADVARQRAPFRTGTLVGTIHALELSPLVWVITVGTKYWKAQEYGARPHPITGDVRFWWEKEGRNWSPGSNTISHPGNPGVHFMQAANDFSRSYFREAARRNFR